MTPGIIWHATLGLKWEVLRVVEDWITPEYRSVLGTPGETRRFVVRVSGPLSVRPPQTGEFVMIVRGFGDGPGGGSVPRKAPLLRVSRRRVQP